MSGGRAVGSGGPEGRRAWWGGGSGRRRGLGGGGWRAAPPSRGLRRRRVGAVLPGWRRSSSGPEPRAASAASLAARCPAALPPSQGEPRGAGSPGRVWGTAGEGARGCWGWSRPPQGRRPVREKGAGSVGTWMWGAPGRPQARGWGPEGEPCIEGPIPCLLPGRRGRERAGGWETGSLQRAGNEAAAV